MNSGIFVAQAAQGSPLGMLLPLVVMFGLYYILVLRPQQKQIQETQAMRNALKVGDAVLTTGGIHGKVVEVEAMTVTLDVATKTKIKFARESIARVLSSGSGDA